MCHLIKIYVVWAKATGDNCMEVSLNNYLAWQQEVG